MDITRPQRKRTTKEYLEKRSGEREMWTAGYKYSWRKMEAAAQDRAGWRQVVCRLCYTGSDQALVKVSEDKGKGKGRFSSSWEPRLRATGCHLPYGITQCYLSPDTSEHAPPNPSHAGRYSICLPQRDGRLS